MDGRVAEDVAVGVERDAVVHDELPLPDRRDDRVRAARAAERVGDRRHHREPDEDGDHRHGREHHEEALRPLTEPPPTHRQARYYGTVCCHCALKSLVCFCA